MLKTQVVNIVFVLLFTSLTAKTQIVLEYTTSEVLCHGASNISINFSLSGGTPPYDYGWKRINNNFIFTQGTLNTDGQEETIGGSFFATSYIIEVVDASGLTLIDTVSISEPPPLLTSEIIIENPNCFNNCDGRISLTAQGGVGNIIITWADIETETSNRSSLCQGSYFYFLIDENNCTQKGIIDLFEPPPIAFIAIIEAPSCLGFENASIYIEELEGGEPPYLYTWENDSHESFLAELGAGSQHLTIEDENDCILDTSFLINQGTELLPNVLINYGCGDGRIIASSNPVNAQQPYDLVWNTGATTSLIHGISAGFYSLTVSDATGCEGIEDFTVDFVEPLLISGHITPVSCPNAEDGGVEIEVEGGIPPYNFSWSNDTQSQHLQNVEGGDYNLNLSSSGCGISESFNIPEASDLMADFIFESGLNDLISATALVTGGNAPYLLSWSNGDIGSIANNLIPTNIYFLTITDNNNCSKTVEFDANLTATSSITEASSINIYPNPATNKVWINAPLIDLSLNTVDIYVFNASGQSIFSNYSFNKKGVELDIDGLSTGLYYLSIKAESRVWRLKFIKI